MGIVFRCFVDLGLSATETSHAICDYPSELASSQIGFVSAGNGIGKKARMDRVGIERAGKERA